MFAVVASRPLGGGVRGGVAGGVGGRTPEDGIIGSGRGGRIWAWMAEEEVEEVVDASVRGEAGEYHH
jgi:hypothetical protein